MLKEEKFEYEVPQLLQSEPLHRVALGSGASCGSDDTDVTTDED